jgi:hypothetical protein
MALWLVPGIVLGAACRLRRRNGKHVCNLMFDPLFHRSGEHAQKPRKCHVHMNRVIVDRQVPGDRLAHCRAGELHRVARPCLFETGEHGLVVLAQHPNLILNAALGLGAGQLMRDGSGKIRHGVFSARSSRKASLFFLDKPARSVSQEVFPARHAANGIVDNPDLVAWLANTVGSRLCAPC